MRSMLADKFGVSTVEGTLAALRTALREAVDDELLENNPAAEVRVPKAVKKLRKPVRAPLTKEEMELLVGSPLPLVEKTMIAVGLFGGLRAGELFAFPLDHVRRRDGLLLLHVEFGGYDGAPTKNGKERWVPIVGPGRALLEQWLGVMPRGGSLNPQKLLFPATDGTRRPFGHAADWLRVRLRAVGIKTNQRFHDLRHTAGEALENGYFGPAQRREHVQAIYGHSSLSQTEAYTGGAGRAMLEAMREFDAAPDADDDSDAKDQRRISEAAAVRENALPEARNEPTGRRTPCFSKPSVVPAPSVDSDPALILAGERVSDPLGIIRTATRTLIAEIASGQATLDDVERWRRTVLAHDPTPLRLVRELPEGDFRVRQAVDVAEAVLRWVGPEQAREGARKDEGR
jgi:integrase